MIATAQPMADGSSEVINRDPEWDLVTFEIKSRGAAPRRENSVINLFGSDGLGKSKFLREALLPYLIEKNLPHALIDFAPNANGNYADEAGPEHLVRDLAEGLAMSITGEPLAATIRERLSAWQPSDGAQLPDVTEPPPSDIEAQEELSRFFDQEIIAGLIQRDEQPRPVVILMDTAEQLAPPLLEWLQDKIQKTTVERGHVLYIMASHYRLECYPFYLRDFFHWHRVEAFDHNETRQQLRKLEDALDVEDVVYADWEWDALTDRVFRLSYGLPAATEVISVKLKELVQPHSNIKLPDFFDRHESELIDEVGRLLDSYLADIQDQEVRTGITVLSSLRLINIAIVNQLLADLLRDSAAPDGRPINSSTFFRRLQRTKRIDWNDKRDSYAIEEPLRQLIARVFAEQHPDRYKSINERALAKFNEWRASVPEKRINYLIEALYHQAVVILLPEATAERQDEAMRVLQQMIRETIDRYYSAPYDDQKLNATLLDELKFKVKTDTDLYLLLGEARVAMLVESIPGKSDDPNELLDA